MFMLKGSNGKGEPKNVNPLLVQNRTDLYVPANYSVSCSALYSADNVNLRKFGVTYHDGTMFTAKQCSYQKEAIYSNAPVY